MNQHRFEILLDKYNNGSANEQERALVESWYIKHPPHLSNLSWQQIEQDKAESLRLLKKLISARQRKLHWASFAVAASALLFAAFGFYFFKYKNSAITNQPFTKNQRQHDLAPGGNKAILMLANGTTIILTGAKNGTLANQGNTEIKKTADGKIIYFKRNNHAGPKTLVYNVASTPRGGQFQFVLSDGTKVWLNSASSIRYPTEFSGPERKVELTGEAYFEVAHDAKKTFRVVSKGQIIEVVGTHFNINSYDDEDNIKTTLLEGSIKLITASGSMMINPGEQAKFNPSGLKVADVDVNEAVAWKNGLFNFKDDNIQTVMRQLARWYDVEIKYEGKMPLRLFSGEISRSIKASQILEILSFKKIHFKIEGRTITVLP